MDTSEAENVLEIGFGSGYCLKRIAESVGQRGKAYGIDISSGMLEVTKRRLENTGLVGRVELCCGDAARLLYEDNPFDATFTSFTLELFNTLEIPNILEEVKRVLKPKGRLGIASMTKENEQSALVKLYEWAHKRWPIYVDCRPIYLEQSLIDARYEVRSKEKVKLFVLPLEIIIAFNAK